MDEATRELKKDDEGNVVISKLNEEALKSIAEKGRGQYQLYSNTDEVVDILMGQLNNMDKRNITDDSMVDYKSFFQIFLGIALLFLIIEIFISEKRKNKNTMGILKPALSLFFVFFTSVSFSQNEKEIIQDGNDAYKKEDYPKAAEEYNKVIQKDPANTTAWYNMGNALYKNKKSDEAIKAYDNALPQLKVRKERSNTFYNKGVVLQNNNKLPECIEAYKQALRLSPDDEDARQNLQKALQQQKQQQQKQDQNKDKKEEKDEPKPQPSKITKQDAEEKLKALMQQEKNLQDKLHKANTAAPPTQGKDW